MDWLLSHINAWSTLVVAATAVVTLILNARMLKRTAEAVEVSERSVYLTALLQEAEMIFRETEQHPDGSQRFGGEQSGSRRYLRKSRERFRLVREEIERRRPDLVPKADQIPSP